MRPLNYKRMLAWRFAANNRRLEYGDKRLIRTNSVLSVNGTPALCSHGMHGSRRIIDALNYSAGCTICRVEIWGKMDGGKDKVCGTHRKTLWWIDGTNVLHEFACRCAEDALNIVDSTDKRSWNAIRVKRLWLAGRATTEELDAAMDAATAAAMDAATAAATAAARAAAWAAARDAAAAMDAATAAAMDAATAAAMDAATAAAMDAATAAAMAAARDAARDKFNRRLTQMVYADHRRLLT